MALFLSSETCIMSNCCPLGLYSFLNIQNILPVTKTASNRAFQKPIFSEKQIACWNNSSHFFPNFPARLTLPAPV